MTVFWLDQRAAVEALRCRATRLRRERPEVEKVVLFGSLAAGRAVPSSDADVLVTVREPLPSLVERGLEYRVYFEELGMPVDVFVYGVAEVPQVPLARRALAEGVVLA